ncbi:MarR family winged helix-turn-helix transcriptional regulator [Arthrobacter sp. StoSoilB22]|uniref:MarR family winged helix-turn-helix transcriptional regulator n=1 Tax=Arthrobacter sp. StoSoilB22 TaxID=2830996 RepID=UPI001CC3F8A7|nr:MarR family winged helix-turn-helix transcriptional regulator [Arthrobacter sp. StoSoilB22]
MTQANSADDLEQSLSFLVSILAKILERRLAKLVGDEFGMAVAEYRVLYQVIRRPGTTVGAIASRTFVDKAQVSRAISVLEGQALISRQVQPTDRRVPALVPTAKGTELMEEILPLRRAHEEAMLSQLTPAQRAVLSSTIGDLIEDLTQADIGARSEPTVAERRRAIRDARMARPQQD